MLSQQEISDRMEITDLMLRYSHAVDTQNWDEYRTVFTDDAVIDYTVFGGPRGSVDDMVEFLGASMPMFSNFQHMIGPPLLEVNGDEATGRTICYNPMEFTGKNGPDVFVCGLWYVDKLRRTADGWKIAERVEEKSYTSNFPSELVPPQG